MIKDDKTLLEHLEDWVENSTVEQYVSSISEILDKYGSDNSIIRILYDITTIKDEN